MPASAWHQFVFILGLGFVVAGLTTYVITWVLVTVHLRDHHAGVHARLGPFLFAPRALAWFLAARYRPLRDRTLGALAFPGSIGAWSIVAGAVAAIVAKVLSLQGGA